MLKRLVCLSVFPVSVAVGVFSACAPSFAIDETDGGATPADASKPIDATAQDAPSGADAPEDAPREASADAGIDANEAGIDAGDAAGDAADGGRRCPNTTTTAMILFNAPGGAFCIDSTEVTVTQYNDFVAAAPASYDVPAACTAFVSADGGRPQPHNEAATHPVGFISYCEAYAYCRWAKKRLCGRIGGGTSTGTGDTTRDEWSYACANGRGDAYPYGATYDPTVCNTPADAGATGALPPKSKPLCHGVLPGFDQVFDMSGNMSEFDDWTNASATEVHTLGGNYAGSAPPRCDTPSTSFGPGTTAFAEAGFRCCADPIP